MAYHTYFISDLHLSDESPEINLAFYRFLDLISDHAKSLVINGDFLNAWWGPAQLKSAFALELASKLAALKEAGCTTHFVKGNRDFLLSADAKSLNMVGHGDYYEIGDAGKGHTIVTHGDQFCLDDKGHMFLRFVIKALPLEFAARVAPESASRGLANWLRGSSKRKHTKSQDRPPSYYDLKDSAMIRYLSKSAAQTMICGHIHQPQERHLLVESEQRRLLVLSDWDAKGAIIAAANPGEAPEMLQFSKGELTIWEHPIRANATPIKKEKS